jgi:hypothetical protein
VFEGDAGLKAFVTAVEKREAGDSKDEKVLESAKETAEATRQEILVDLTSRADRLLRTRVDREGMEAFKSNPVAWFEDAMKTASKEVTGVARRRYGDPNKIGLSPAAASAKDEIGQWLESHKPKGPTKYDPSKSSNESHRDFADALAHAVLSDMRGGTKA